MIVNRSLTVVLVAALAVVAPAAGEGPSLLVYPRFNTTYRDMAPDITPVTSAGMTINLSSPTNSLTLRDHWVELEPLGGGVHRFRAMADFLGKADLLAEFEASVPGRIEDQVLLPIQQVEIEGEIEIVRDAEGFLITTRKLPEHAEILMQSRLGNQLLSLCDMMSILTGSDCSGLSEAFTRVRLPLPKPPETYRIGLEELTEEEFLRLDDYLRSAG